MENIIKKQQKKKKKMMALPWLACTGWQRWGNLSPTCSPSLPSPLPISPSSPAASPTLAVPKTPWCEQDTPNPSSARQHVACSTQPSWGEELLALRCLGLACGGHSTVPPLGQAESHRLFPSGKGPGAARLEHPQGVCPRCRPV